MKYLVVGMIFTDFRDHFQDSLDPLVSNMKEAIHHIFAGLSGPDYLFVFLAPEFYFSKKPVSGRPQCLSESEKQGICASICRMSKFPKNLLLVGGSILWRRGQRVYNTVPMAFNGQLWERDKTIWGGEIVDISQERGREFVARADVGPVLVGSGFRFPIPGTAMHFGVEVCSEHQVGALKQQTPEVDIHIVISNHTKLVWNNRHARDGGYVLHCDPKKNPLKSGHGLYEIVFHRKGMRYRDWSATNFKRFGVVEGASWGSKHEPVLGLERYPLPPRLRVQKP